MDVVDMYEMELAGCGIPGDGRHEAEGEIQLAPWFQGRDSVPSTGETVGPLSGLGKMFRVWRRQRL